MHSYYEYPKIVHAHEKAPMVAIIYSSSDVLEGGVYLLFALGHGFRYVRLIYQQQPFNGPTDLSP